MGFFVCVITPVGMDHDDGKSHFDGFIATHTIYMYIWIGSL